MQAAERADKCRFLSLVAFTFNLQICPSEGPNTSSVRIWHKYTNKNYRLTTPKTEPSTVHCMP